MPTFLSLFTGIGGLDLGLERAGWTCIGQVENDPYCQRVLAKHWPNVPRWGDIKELNPDELPQADLICGGFPCQPVSVAGRRRGQEDERWLWPELHRIVRALRPRWVLLENVPGLLVRGMGDVLGDLASSGYDAEWDCIPAAALGAPHLRYRVFVVAYPQRGELRLQPGRRNGQSGPAKAIARDNGSQELVANPQGKRGALRTASGERPWRPPSRNRWWESEPDVGRVAHGIPARVDRLRALGNAVVPQVAELIGRRILQAWEDAA